MKGPPFGKEITKLIFKGVLRELAEKYRNHPTPEKSNGANPTSNEVQGKQTVKQAPTGIKVDVPPSNQG